MQSQIPQEQRNIRLPSFFINKPDGHLKRMYVKVFNCILVRCGFVATKAQITFLWKSSHIKDVVADLKHEVGRVNH